MFDRVLKFRIATGRKRKAYVLITVFPDGRKTFQVLTGDEDDQPFPVMTGPAEINWVKVTFDDGPAEVRALRLHIRDAEHLSAEAADATSPRLLALFPDVLCYVYGSEPEVYDIATGEVVGLVTG